MKQPLWRSAWWSVWLLTLVAALPRAHAEPPPLERIPDVLEPWIPWVLESAGDAICPLVSEVRHCVWPSALEVSANESGASFTLRVTADRKGTVALPGSNEHWPEGVRLDNQPTPVLEVDGAPMVRVAQGAHVLTGSFRWPELPDSLLAPANVGTLLLTVNGARVAAPKREESGLVWLRQSAKASEEAERLELTVHRRMDDGVPLRTTTRIHVSASGSAREVVLPRVLVAGTHPIELRADLPAQLALDGTLRLQAQAGDYLIEIVAVREAPVDALTAPEPGAPWPEREIWVWHADDRLRHAEIEGAPQIDPTRTDLEPDWHGLPTFVVGQGHGITIATKRRGEPEPPPNQLTLARSLWLDLDGDGYTVKDSIRGTMNERFRIDLLEGELGHAVVDGVDQLITVHDKKNGVEVRKSEIALDTEWRLEHGRAALPAVGYGEDVQSLSATLNLPPGFLLLGAKGVDQVPGTWLDGWDLWDFFFVLLMSLGVAKVRGPLAGALALATLVLTHHEGNAPMVGWLFLLASAALVRVAKEGTRFDKVARVLFGLSLASVLLIFIPFAVEQARAALYPHLHAEHGGFMTFGAAPEPYMDFIESKAAVMEEAAPATPAAAAPAEAGGAADSAQSVERVRGSAEKALGISRSYGGVQKNAYDKSEVDPNTVVQTGPGLPTWNFRQFALTWSGPVEKSERVELWIAPPLVTRLWSVLDILLGAALLFALASAARKPRAPSAPAGMAAGALLVILALFVPGEARAQTVPPSDVLEDLKGRLLAPAECEPNCISVEKLELAIEASRLTLKASVHAGSKVAYQAPGPLESWAPDGVRVDGKEALAAARLDDGFLYVRLEPGLHIVELTGVVPRSQALTLALGTPPHRVTAHAPGYTIEGLRKDGRAEGSLELRRQVVQDDGPEGSEQSLAEWLEVERTLDLGVRFRVLTRIQRIGPATESMLVRLPLLPGESVTEAGLISEDGRVLVELPRDSTSVSFSSSLALTKQIDLHAGAPTDAPNGPLVRPWSETWVVRCSALYRCTVDGIAPVSRTGDDGMLALTYKPYPGEQLSVHADRLEAAKGASVTIDNAELALTPGARMEESKLTFSVRTSRGTTERFELPKNAMLRSLRVDGTDRPARFSKGVLEVVLGPGAHQIEISLQAARGMGFSYASSPVRAARPLVNATTTVTMPPDRWLLWADGPDWGPAVLFWGYMIVVLLAALALVRVPHSPLRAHEWLLLGLGLTQVEVPVTLVIVGWLFSLSYRQRSELSSRRVFNLMQIALVMFTLVALSCLAYAIHRGLVVQPDMQVQGMGSTNQLLRWYVDRSVGSFAQVTVLSAPLWIYKALMLAWALWLAASLIRWLRFGFAAFRRGGAWRPKPPAPPVSPRPENPRVPLEDIAAAQEALTRKVDTNPGVGDPGPGEST